MQQRHVNLIVDEQETAERRAEYYEQSGGFALVVVCRIRGGQHDGRWLVRAERLDNMEA